MARSTRKAHGPYTDEHGEYFSLPLTQGYEAKIDRDQVTRVEQWNWSVSLESRGTKLYARRVQRIEGKPCKIRLHHFVLDIFPGQAHAEGFVIDHIGDDGLDCRRGRLQRITQDQNMDKVPTWKKKGMKLNKPIEEPFL